MVLQIAVALGGEVHLYNAESGKPSPLCTLPEADIVTSLNWSADGKHLAVGTSAAKVGHSHITCRLTCAYASHAVFICTHATHACVHRTL